MAKRRKRVYSTKPRSSPKPEPKLAPPPQDKPGPELLTKKEAIAEFYKNPRPEQFCSTGPKGFALAVGDRYIKFKDGFYTTSDPFEVEALLRADNPTGGKYLVHFFAINPALRNFKT